MKIGVLLLNFGEPENATMEEVVPFLERIFVQNAGLAGHATPEQVRERSRRLAEERAPGLIEEYERIGGSPLQRQAEDQARALEAELERRGHRATVRLGMQFTEPSIADAAAAVLEQGVDRLVGLPVYPLSGPSTSVAALEDLDRAVRQSGRDVPLRQVNGWHRHPAYVQLRVDAIRRVLEQNGLMLGEDGTRLVFSAHGTPMKYIEEGSRYNDYVQEFCARVAEGLGGVDYTIGYQNHTNRPGVRWTQPDVDKVIAGIDAKRVVVDAVSFMHEQSETLAELDHELREEAESRGLEFYRVPVPHAAPEFIGVLADLVEAVALPDGSPVEAHAQAGKPFPLKQCVCKPTPHTCCTNGDRR
jgi:protoporphyrin/coproporphyrin ferrochelatase